MQCKVFERMMLRTGLAMYPKRTELANFSRLFVLVASAGYVENIG